MPAPIDEKTKEKIIAEYALSNSVNGVAEKYNVAWATAKKIVKEAETEINRLREEKRQKYVNDAWEVVYVYLNKLMDPKTIKEAKARDCISVVTGMIERIQKQQELNQQFDIMYDNVEKEIREGILKEVWNDSAVSRELNRMFTARDEKVRLGMKEKIKASMAKKNLVLVDESERREKAADRNKKEFNDILDQIKKELMDEYGIEEDIEE